MSEVVEREMIAVSDFKALIGKSIGMSPWFEMTQDRVTAFGGITLDFDPHHIDPRQAQKGPFGVAVAQGFLTLSLLTHFVETTPSKLDFRQHINYGFNKIRFIQPAVVGHHLQANFILSNVQDRGENAHLITFTVEVSSREAGHVVLAAEWLTMVLV